MLMSAVMLKVMKVVSLVDKGSVREKIQSLRVGDPYHYFLNQLESSVSLVCNQVYMEKTVRHVHSLKGLM